MQAWFASGGAIDLALAVLLLEAIALLAWHGRAALGIAATLAAGGSVLLAWRFAALGFDWPWIGAALLAALGFHLADVAARLPGPR
jgi:hypothetical protein